MGDTSSVARLNVFGAMNVIMALAVIIWHFLKKLTLCRVTADDGTHGGARHMQRRKEPVTKNMIGAVGRVVEGHSVFENRHLTRTAFDDFQIRRSAVDHYAAWSAIEIALWDIVGKICKRPVYNLLGGPVRDHVRVYANGW